MSRPQDRLQASELRPPANEVRSSCGFCEGIVTGTPVPWTTFQAASPSPGRSDRPAGPEFWRPA
jgi:hypothetical protein